MRIFTAIIISSTILLSQSVAVYSKDSDRAQQPLNIQTAAETDDPEALDTALDRFHQTCINRHRLCRETKWAQTRINLKI